MASEHLLYMRENTLMAQRFDPDRLELSGDPFPAVTDDVAVNLGNGAAGFTVSSNAVLAYRAGVIASQRVMNWFDASGRQTGTVGAASPYQNPAISPDMQRVAVFRQDGGAGDVWIFDLMRGTSSRFTFDPSLDTSPIWSPDGSRIVFASNRGGVFDLYEKDSGGAGQEQQLLKSGEPKIPEDWSHNGRFIVYRTQRPQTGLDLWVLPLEGNRDPRPLLQSPFAEMSGRFSPDGRWMAYVSNETGQFEVYVQTFPTSGGKWQISSGGGVQPRWRKDGKMLYFMSLGTAVDRQVMAVDIATSPDGALKAGVAQGLFAVNPVNLLTDRNSWDVTPDGQRFLVNTSTAQAQTGQVAPVIVVVNWLPTENAGP
jgi:Tol biopolymer transport system component